MNLENQEALTAEQSLASVPLQLSANEQTKGECNERHWTSYDRICAYKAASARLGKLAVYGVIDRRPNPYGRSNEYRYQLKPV